jgi:hypothetical protein
MTLCEIGLLALGVLVLVCVLNILVARWNDKSARGEM